MSIIYSLIKNQKAAVLLLILIFISFGWPIVLGWSWIPLPFLPHVINQAGIVSKYSYAADVWSFPQVDWAFRLIERQQLLNGEFPLWNPYGSLGLPFPGQYQNQLFFPLEWLEIFLNPLGWNVMLLVKLFIAGYGAYLLGKHCLQEERASYVMVVLYVLSGFFLWLYTVPAFVNGFMLVPWLLLFTLEMFEVQSKLKKNTLKLGLIIGFLWLSGQPQISALACLGAGICFLWLAGLHFKQPKILRSAFLSYVVANIIGFFISAPQLVLFYQMMKNGYSLHSPGAYALSYTATLNLVTTIFPFILGQMQNPWNIEWYPSAVNWEAFPLILGTSGLLLGSIGFIDIVLGLKLRDKGNQQFLPVLFVTLLILLIIIFGKDYIFIWKAPILNQINLSRYSPILLTLGIGILVGRGITVAQICSKWVLVVASVFVISILGFMLKILISIFDNIPSYVDPNYLKASIILGLGPFFIISITVITLLWMARKNPSLTNSVQWGLLICVVIEFLFFVRYGFDISDEIKSLVWM